MHKTPWEDSGWSRARYFSFIRSGLRSLTMKYPAKQKYLHQACRPAPAGSRFKYVTDCEICGILVGKSHVEVDHIQAAGSLKSYEDLPGFVERLLCSHENFQCLCSDCHSVKTVADRKGISFEDAKVEKMVIAFSKKAVNAQKTMLTIHDIPEDVQNNQANRTNAYRNHLNAK